MRTNRKLQTLTTALALTLLLASGALAQVGGDIIGATPIKDAAIAVMKIVAIAGIGFGFMRLMSGRHTVEGLTVMGIGALGIAKVDALAGLMGL